MRTDSLFAELALRLAPHPESVATEALVYILRRYPATWTPLRAWLGLTGTPLPEGLRFRSQVFDTTDGAIPDLVGVDSSGDAVLIAEAKFWASLTVNQPATYLKRLPPDKNAIVLVIAPGMRFETLWAKLLQNCAIDAIIDGAHVDVVQELRAAPAGSNHRLVLTSWRAVLGVLLRNADMSGDKDLLSDLDQLSGLCSRMDSTEFLPLSAEDVSRQIGQRIQQFVNLVDKTVEVLVQHHKANTEKLKTGGSGAEYGRYFRLRSLACFLVYSPPLWSRFGDTPLWLRVKDSDWKVPQDIHEMLDLVFAGLPNRICEQDGDVYVGIDLPIGVEMEVIVSKIAEQVLWAADKCDVRSSNAT